jgi:four helix bundle protein
VSFKKRNILQEKSFSFAVKIVKLCLNIQKSENEYILTKQLLRSGTSIGANVEESIGGRSDKDLYHRLVISYKEARESHYWIRLLFEADLIAEQQKNELIENVDELLRILGASKRTLKSNMSSSES